MKPLRMESGVLVAVVEARLHLRVYHVEGHAKVVGGEVAVGSREGRHDARDDDRPDPIEAQTFEREKTGEEDGELVGRAVYLGGDPPLSQRLLAVEEPEDRLRV